MNDLHDHIQVKTDLITSLVATAGIPAPFLVSIVDETGKLAAMVYSIFGAIYMAKQIWKSRRK